MKIKSDQTLGLGVGDSREILIALLEAVSELMSVGADTGVTDGVVVYVLFPLPPFFLTLLYLTCYVFPGAIENSCQSQHLLYLILLTHKINFNFSWI